MAEVLPDFDAADLARRVEQLATEQIDSLPFGAIRLAADNTILLQSAAERRLSGFGERASLGKHFFHDIAPCMDQEEYRGRIERALAAGKLDLQFTHYGDFEDRDRELTVRVQSASDGGCWIFMRREA